MLPRLTMNGEHLPAALQLLEVALEHAAADPSGLSISQYAPDALGCALCCLLAAGGRESLTSALLEATVRTLAMLREALKPAAKQHALPEDCGAHGQALLSARVGLTRYAAQLHWTVALLLHDVCGEPALASPDTDGSDCSSVLAWAEGRVPMLCGQINRSSNAPTTVKQPEPEPEQEAAGMVVQTLSDLLFSCALADASLQPSVELLTQLWAQQKGDGLSQSDDKNHQPARRLVAWAAERPLELSHMTVSCVARLLPRLAQTEAQRLLCTALPRLLDGALLPQPPTPQPQQMTGVEPEAGPTAAPERDFGAANSEHDAAVSALRIGALAAVLWIQTAYPAAFPPTADANSTLRIARFLAAWPYSSSMVGPVCSPGPEEPLGVSTDPDGDTLRRLALESTRHSITCVQHACADSARERERETQRETQREKEREEGASAEHSNDVGTIDAAVEHLGQFTLACGLLSCSAHAADSVSGSDGAGMGSCAKTANILALNLLQSRRERRSSGRRTDSAASQHSQSEWERAVSEVRCV